MNAAVAELTARTIGEGYSSEESGLVLSDIAQELDAKVHQFLSELNGRH